MASATVVGGWHPVPDLPGPKCHRWACPMSVGRRPKRATLRQIDDLHFPAAVKSTDVPKCVSYVGRDDAGYETPKECSDRHLLGPPRHHAFVTQDGYSLVRKSVGATDAGVVVMSRERIWPWRQMTRPPRHLCRPEQLTSVCPSERTSRVSVSCIARDHRSAQRRTGWMRRSGEDRCAFVTTFRCVGGTTCARYEHSFGGLALQFMSTSVHSRIAKPAQ